MILLTLKEKVSSLLLVVHNTLGAHDLFSVTFSYHHMFMRRTVYKKKLVSQLSILVFLYREGYFIKNIDKCLIVTID